MISGGKKDYILININTMLKKQKTSVLSMKKKLIFTKRSN